MISLRGLIAGAALAAPLLFMGAAKAAPGDLLDVSTYGQVTPIYRVTGHSRPAGCPRMWCGCWLSLDQYGRNIRRLWLARNWKYEGRPAERGCIGCIAVLSRGKRGGHVGRVLGWVGSDPIIISGNHNRRVGTAVYPVRRLIALRSV